MEREGHTYHLSCDLDRLPNCPEASLHLIRVPPATLESVEAAIRASPKVKFVEKHFLGGDP
jgi:hypothetical protein